MSPASRAAEAGSSGEGLAPLARESSGGLSNESGPPQNLKAQQSSANDLRQDTEQRDRIQRSERLAPIQEWMLQEHLLLKEVRRFKPVREPTNPNPPWEHYVLRQRELLRAVRYVRRHIEFLGEKDQFMVELNKVSEIAHRMLELVNTGEYTQYESERTSYEDIVKLTQASAADSEARREALARVVKGATRVPVLYQDQVETYFERISERT